MSAHDNGGPAFPVAYGDGRIEGMTLRDYFAAKAMAAWIATYGDNPHPATTGHAETVANNAYQIADAMLAERSKR